MDVQGAAGWVEVELVEVLLVEVLVEVLLVEVLLVEVPKTHKFVISKKYSNGLIFLCQ